MAPKKMGMIEKIKAIKQDVDIVIYVRSMLKKTKVRVVIGILIGIVIVTGVYGYRKYRQYTGYKVLQSIEIDSGTNSKYIPFMDFVVKYSSDGISYIDGEEAVWDDAHEMKAPIVDACGEYLVIADKNTNDIYLYNEDGKQGRITTTYPVVKVEVAKQGVVAALLEDKHANYIEVYNKEGKRLVSHKTFIDENGYPLNFSISDDGTKMVVSYLAVNNGTMNNKLMFYNFSKTGKNVSDKIIGNFDQYEETLVPMVQFVSESTVVGIGENIFSIYRVRDKASLKEEVVLKDEIQKVFYSEDYVGFVFANRNSKKPYRIEVYNMNGNREIKTDIDMDFDTVCFAEDNVLMYDDMNCEVISLNGVKKFEHTFKGQINAIIPLSGDNTYLFMTNSAIEKVKLK